MIRESATFWEVVFDLSLWLAIYASLKPVLKAPYTILNRNQRWAYVFILLFCLFPFFGGDYFHYILNYDAAKSGGYAHIEDIYVWFIENWCTSYHMFRLGVWGTALLVLFTSYKYISNNIGLVLFFFGVLYLPWFSYARVSLAMALIFCGLCLCVKPINKLKKISFLFGLSIMLTSIAFHRSAFIGIVCALGSLFFGKPNRKTIIILSILFPLAIFVLTYALGLFMSLDLGYDDFISGRQRDDYLLDENTGGLAMGIGPFIMVFLTRAPMFIVAFAYIYYAFKGYFTDFTYSERIISSYSFLVILLALVFSFDLGFNTYSLYYRTLTFSHIPSAIFLSKIYLSGRSPRLYKWIYIPTIIGVLYTLVYSAYCTFFC